MTRLILASNAYPSRHCNHPSISLYQTNPPFSVLTLLITHKTPKKNIPSPSLDPHGIRTPEPHRILHLGPDLRVTYKASNAGYRSQILDLRVIHQASNAGYRNQTLDLHGPPILDLRNLPDQRTPITFRYRKDLHEDTISRLWKIPGSPPVVHTKSSIRYEFEKWNSDSAAGR